MGDIFPKLYRHYESNVNIIDLETGLKYITRQFEELEMDADHEIVYGEGRYQSVPECLRLVWKVQNLVSEYQNG